MKRFIDADLCKAQFTGNFQGTYPTALIKALIDDTPAADVLEVRYGCWYCIETGYAVCDNCNRSIYVGGDVRSETLDIIENEMFEFCPHCGAKMRTKEEQKIADL